MPIFILPPVGWHFRLRRAFFNEVSLPRVSRHVRLFVVMSPTSQLVKIERSTISWSALKGRQGQTMGIISLSKEASIIAEPAHIAPRLGSPEELPRPAHGCFSSSLPCVGQLVCH